MAATVPKGDRLPSDWSYSVTRDGRVFFINERTQTTTWLHPLTGRPVQTGNSPAQDLPAGWEQAVTLDGTLYFIDHNNCSTSFDHPLTGAPSIYDPSARSPPHSPQAPLSPSDRNKKPFPKQKNIKAPSAKRNPTSTVMRRGWLYRWENPAIGKSWKKRWCVLADFALFVYKDEQEVAAVASVLLPSYRINPMTPADQVFREYGFKLEHENTKTLFFATDNQADLDRWMSLLTQAAMMKGQQGFVREANNNRLGGRHRSQSQEEDEMDYLQHPELNRSWKDPGSYRKMQKDEDMEPPDPRDFSDEYPGNRNHQGQPYPDERRDPRGDPRMSRDYQDPRENQDRNSMARNSDRGSMSRQSDREPNNRDSMSRSNSGDPYSRDSMSRSHSGDPYHRDSMSRPQGGDPYNRDSMSRSQSGDPYNRDSMSRSQSGDPYNRDSMSRSHGGDPYNRDSMPRSHGGDPYNRDSMSRSHGGDPYNRDSMSRSQSGDPYNRDSMSRPQDRDSMSRPSERGSMSRPHERDSMARQSDRGSMSRPYDRDSMSNPYDRDSLARQSDRHRDQKGMMRPQDRTSMSTLSRHSYDPRHNQNDPYSSERNSMVDQRDGQYQPNRDSMTDPRNSYNEPHRPHLEGEDPYRSAASLRHEDPRNSLPRADVRSSHLEGEDPYARIRDVSRSESHGFVPHENDPRYGSYEGGPEHQKYGSDDVQRRHPDYEDHPPRDQGSDPRDPNGREHQLHNGSHPGDYDNRNYRPNDEYISHDDHQRNRLSRASDYSGYGDPRAVQKDPEAYVGDRSSRASDNHGVYGQQGDRLSHASGHYSVNGQRDRGSRASAHDVSPVASYQAHPAHHGHPGHSGHPGNIEDPRQNRSQEDPRYSRPQEDPLYNRSQEDPLYNRSQEDPRFSRSQEDPGYHRPQDLNSPPSSGSPRRQPGLTVNIPPTYVNVDESGQGVEQTSPGRPPYPTQMRQEIARDLAQSKTPRTSSDYLISAENEAKRRQQSPYFQYPSPREQQQPRDPREIQDGRERPNDRMRGQGNQGEGRIQGDPSAQEMRNAYEKFQQQRQRDSFSSMRKSLDLNTSQDLRLDTKQAESNQGRNANGNTSPSEVLYSSGGSYIKNLDQPEDIYERGSAFRPPSSCTSSIRGDTLERRSKENYPPLSDMGSRSSINKGDNFEKSNESYPPLTNMGSRSNINKGDPLEESYPPLSDKGSRSNLNNGVDQGPNETEAEDPDGNYIKMTRAYAREIGKSYIQDKWSGPKEETYARPQRKNRIPRMMSTVKEDPNMSDGEVLNPREIKNLNKKYPLNGGRVRMSISAGDLIGKTHDELVLLLIQLRRNQSALEKAKDFYRQRLSERRPNEREYKRQRSDSVGRLDRELEQDHQVYQDYKTQLEEIENKLEVYKPLINLVDNMVTMGSLYGGDNYMLATQYRKHLLRPDQYTEPKDMLIFSRQHQEKKFVQEIEDEIKHLSAEEVDLEEKLERLYELDRNLQEQSFKVISFREDKELLEKALQGIIRQQDISRNDPREMSKLVHQQITIEKELSLIMQQLAEASQQLEETTAENNKIEHEVALLRTKVNGELSRSRSAVSLGGGDAEKTKQQMEKELAKVNNIMAGLSAERGRLSQAMSTLRRSSSGTQLAPLLDKDSEPGKKKPSTYMVTDLDTMESVNMSNLKSPVSPYLSTPRSKSMGDLRFSPGAGNSPLTPQAKPLDSPDRGMMVRSYAEGLNQPVMRHPIISHQRQESSLATSTDATDNVIDPDDPNSTWDISEAEENTKRFFGIIPRERPKVLTVRDVKRQSEQRKEREKTRKGPDDEGNTGWYSVSSSQQIPTDSESDIPSHVRYPSDISSSYASEISHLAHPTDPGPLYENLPRADHLERTASVPVLANFNSNPSSRRSSIGLLAPKPFTPYQDRSSSGIAPSGIYTARPFFSEMNLSSQQTPVNEPREVMQTQNSAFTTPVVFKPSLATTREPTRAYAPKPWGSSSGVFNVKKSPKGRFMTISSSEPSKRETTQLGNTLHSAAGDLMMNRSIDNVPDIVKSSTQKVDNDAFDEYTIEREILFRPDKVLIPERYQPDSDEEDLTESERIERIEKAEKIKQILASQSVHSLSQPDISRIGDNNIHRKVEIEKQRRSHLLALNHDLAKQVTIKSKQDAAKRRKTWSGGQFAEAFPHGIERGVFESPQTSFTQHRSNVLV